MAEEQTQTTTQTSTEPAAPAPPASNGAATPADAPPKAEGEKKADPLGPAFAAIVKREKRLNEERAKLAADRKALDDERAALAKSRDEDAALSKLAQENPGAALRQWAKRHGLSEDPYEAITRAALKQPKKGEAEPAAVAELRKEIDSLKSSIAEREANEKKRLEEEATAAQQKAIESFKSEIKAHIHGAKDKYEAIVESGAEAEVFNLIREQYVLDRREKGDAAEPLSIEEASTIIEEKLTERIRKLAALKKIQAAPAGGAQAEQKPEADAPTETSAGTKRSPDGPTTLGNHHAAQVVSHGQPPSRRGAKERAAEQERLERALKRYGVK